MIYHFSLYAMGMTVGIALLVTHIAALVLRRRLPAWLRQFPRSRPAGIALCTLAALWAFTLAATMDLGEFSPNRTMICSVIVLGAVIVPLWAEEFLAVRALGILALLAAEPLLGAAFLRPEQTRLLVVILAYGWIVGGLFMVGAPYLLRDLIGWFCATQWRYLLAAWSGVAYGSLLIAVSLFCF